MCKIDIVIANVSHLSKTVAVLRRAEPDIGVAELIRRINADVPVVEYTLFGNNHPAVAAKLRTLLTEIPKSGATLRILQINQDEQFDRVAHAIDEIPASTLTNILDEAEGDFE
ncbi:MAG: hypothetical protein H0T46_34875 [Deltaproteobacteria bacterium]|nr:hypothetical protein [Deltaproteobacteria bacterium]